MDGVNVVFDRSPLMFLKENVSDSGNNWMDGWMDGGMDGWVGG